MHPFDAHDSHCPCHWYITWTRSWKRCTGNRRLCVDLQQWLLWTSISSSLKTENLITPLLEGSCEVKWHSMRVVLFFSSCPFDLSFSSGVGVGGLVLRGDFSLAVSLLQMQTPESTMSLASCCPQQALQCPLKRVFFPAPTLKRPHYLPPKSSPRLDLESSSRRPLPKAGVPGSESLESSWKSSPLGPTPRVCDWAGVRRGWRICISNKFSGDVHVAGFGSILRTADPTLSHNSIWLW